MNVLKPFANLWKKWLKRMHNKGAFVTASELADYLHCSCTGDKNKKIYGISLIRDCNEDTLTLVPERKSNVISEMNAGVIFTRSFLGLPIHKNYILCRDNPYNHLAEIIDFMIIKGIYSDSRNEPEIAEHTILENGVVLGKNVFVGKGCYIGANTVIGNDTIIDDNVRIGSCCSIGTENFEYEKKINGWEKVPVVGNVHIHSNVIIGGNVVVEKGTIGTTRICSGTQIENLVQVGHECIVGENCHIAACTALAGWAEIGCHVDIYGQAAVSNNVKVGNNCILLARAGIDKNIAENSVMWGSPAQEHKTELRYRAYLKRLFRDNKKGCELK